MTNDYKYHLAGRNDSRENRKKRTCPHCGRKTFVLYIINETGLPLHESVGKCDRLDHCAWHYSPKQYFADRGSSFDRGNKCPPAGSYGQQSPEKPPQPTPSYMDKGMAEKTLCQYENNNFVLWLREQVGEEAANEAIRRYRVGTSKHWDGATVFWQIDGEGRIRTGKIMLYDRQTGHRIKVNGRPLITWVHSILKLTDYNLSQCLFGEHLLAGNDTTVAIVESEKSALVASIYLPEFVWLATGGCGNLSAERGEPLRGRKVILYPDAGMYNKWKEKAALLSTICDVSVSDLIERRATEDERKAGLDLADYLLRELPPTATAEPQPAPPPEPPAIERLQPDTIKSITEQETPAEGKETEQNRAVARLPKPQGGWYMKTYEQGWDAEIRELEMFFNNRRDNLPESVKTGHSEIVNVPLFIESHLARAKAHNGNPTFQPYLDRLTELKFLIEMSVNEDEACPF